jgi:hypothetical protein
MCKIHPVAYMLFLNKQEALSIKNHSFICQKMIDLLILWSQSDWMTSGGKTNNYLYNWPRHTSRRVAVFWTGLLLLSLTFKTLKIKLQCQSAKDVYGIFCLYPCRVVHELLNQWNFVQLLYIQKNFTLYTLIAAHNCGEFLVHNMLTVTTFNLKTSQENWVPGGTNLEKLCSTVGRFRP